MLSVARRQAQRSVAPAIRAVSTWQAVPAGPPDPILGKRPCAERVAR
jgi:hypothetical protein